MIKQKKRRRLVLAGAAVVLVTLGMVAVYLHSLPDTEQRRLSSPTAGQTRTLEAEFGISLTGDFQIHEAQLARHLTLDKFGDATLSLTVTGGELDEFLLACVPFETYSTGENTCSGKDGRDDTIWITREDTGDITLKKETIRLREARAVFF